jgi:signal transduction histidine kinase
MKFAELIPLTGSLLNFSLAVFVLLQNPKATIARVYFLLGLCLSIWNFGTFQMFRVSDYEDALFWARFLQFGVIFIPLTLFHISALVAQVRVPRKVAIALYAFHGCLALSNLTDLFLRGVRNVGYAWYSVAGPGFWILFGIFSLMWVSVGILVWYRRKLPPVARRSITPMIVAQTAIALFGCNDALPILGYDYYPLTHYQIYPFGSMAVILYGMIVGYSVLQYQLLDVRVALNRGTAKAVRVLFIFLTGLCTLLLLWLFGRNQFTAFSFFAGLVALMTGAVCAGVLFPRLFGESSETVERRVLGDTFEYQDQVRNFIAGMTWYTDMYSLLNDLHELLVKAFKLKSYQIILRDETTRVFTLFRAHPEQAQRQLPELRTESPVFRFFDWGKATYLAISPDNLRRTTSSLERQALEQLQEFGGQFCFPLASQSEPFGLFIVGDKINGEPFTSTNISLLVSLMKNLSLMVNQIRLKNHIMQTQELDLLGRMSRGMAHDLNNLLTPVWTLFQLSAEVNESGKPPAFDDELLPSALRNIKIMRAYIREALFFSENLRPDIQLGRLDMIVKQAAELGRASRKKPVNLITETPDNVLVELDEVLVQRLIANLISNAIDASPEGSTIRVELVRLAKTETDRDWLRVRIIDQGEGIRKEDLNRIFTPYFTTKTHGDENRGFGLGLAICRKIVNLHGGNVSIASELKKGTTVELDLPSRQQKNTPPTVPQPA